MSTYVRNVCRLVFNCVSNPPYHFIFKGKFFKRNSQGLGRRLSQERPCHDIMGTRLRSTDHVKTEGVVCMLAIPALGEAEINNRWTLGSVSTACLLSSWWWEICLKKENEGKVPEEQHPTLTSGLCMHRHTHSPVWLWTPTTKRT